MKRRSLNRPQLLFLIISLIVAIGMICSLIATIAQSPREDTGVAPPPALAGAAWEISSTWPWSGAL